MFRHIKLKFMLALCLVSNSYSVANAADAYCAVVKIEIQQELSLERQAFDAVMKINNGLDTMAIEDVSISVNFKDENGDPVVATNIPDDPNTAVNFFIRVDTMSGINNIDGAGVVLPSSSAEIRWLIIPTTGAAEGFPGGKLYFVGAHLAYTLGGKAESVDVIPDFITVKPLPQLSLDYFLTEEVIGDDAFTTAIESPEPYTLGVRIKNTGTGIANNIKIDSAQPKIVENEQGLLIDFLITGSTLNDQPAAPTLLIDFGTINPGEATVGRWIMETSLSGKFIEFTAKLSHADELGGAVTSIIDSNDINTHFLLRDVRVDLPGRDMVRDFLGTPASSNGALKVYESDAVDSDVNNLSTNAVYNSGSSAFTISTPPPGFIYARVPDPYLGQKVVTSAIRSDGKVMLLNNVWASKTRDRNVSPPAWDYWLNVFDVNSTGKYIVNMNAQVIGPMPPVIQVITNKETYEGNQVGFIVESSDPNGDNVVLTAEPLPTGASFVDNGNGTAFFNWTPSVGQAGTYLITYKSTDGVLTAKRTATIKVFPAGDTDGDGLDDAWEISHFGDLSHDGLADSDGDGVSDLDEFLNGTDPNLPPPPAPTDLVGASGNLQATLNWSAVTGATGYRVYWSDVPNVTKTLGYLIDNTASPFNHTGLTNGTSYYYAVTSVGPGGESDISSEIKVTPGNKNWGSPGIVENSNNTISAYQLAYADNGTGMTVWTENDSGNINLWSNLYSVDTGWGTPVLITSNTILDDMSVQLRMNDFGNAIVIWQQTEASNDSLWSKTYSADGAWGSTLQIISTNTGELGEAELILTESGAAMVSWLRAEAGQSQLSQVWSSLLFANASVWDTAVRVDDNLGTVVSALQLANDDLGNVITVWSQTVDAGTTYNFAFNLFNNSTWGTEQIIRSGMHGDTNSPDVDSILVMNKKGEALLAWSELNTVNSIMTMHYTLSGGWEVASLIEFDNVHAAYDPAVDINDSGDAIVAWTQSNGTQNVIFSNRYSVVSGWEAIPTIVSSKATGDPVGEASKPKVKIDAAGDSLVVWEQLDSLQSNIWANRFNSLTSWGYPQIIETDNDGDAKGVIVEIDANGNALSMWRYSDGVSTSLMYNSLLASNTGVPNIKPIIIFPSAITVDASTDVTIDASLSFDQDGFIALNEWTQLSGTPVVLNGKYTHTLNFTAPSPDVEETLVFRLQVTDGDALVAFKDIDILVKPNANEFPIVDAGLDQAVNESSVVNLLAIASDIDGTIVGYQWSQVSGNPVVLSENLTNSASFVAPILKTTETFIFNLTVTDNSGDTANDQVQITVNPVNTLPVVNAGIDRVVPEQQVTNLTGGAIDPDADGSIVSYTWNQLSGPAVVLSSANTANVSFTTPTLIQQSILMLRLTAVDDEGGVSSDDVVITVNPVNISPVANAGIAKAINEQTITTLKGAGSDVDGNIVSYAWSQTSGVTVALGSANTSTAIFTSPAVLVQDGPQVLSFTLTVTDNEAAVSSDVINITVNPVNVAATVNAGTDQSVDEQTVVNLSGTATDTDGTIASYAWTQTAGMPVDMSGTDVANASFTTPIVLVQDGPQVLSFTLTVTDNEAAVSSDVVNVTVNPVNVAPVVNTSADQMIGENILVNISAVANDSDGSIATYSWSQLSGPTMLLTGSQTENANFVSPFVYQDTQLMIQVKVTDNEGGQAIDTIMVTVYSTNPDDDADGMDDAWEMNAFGNLTLDGNGDFDNDGFTDYQEYQQGTNPLLFTLPAPTDLMAVADDSQITLNWATVNGAVGYNIYWSTSSGVTRSNGTLIHSVDNQYIHTGLTNGITYYYVVTALNDDESAVSVEASASPGIRVWNTSQRIDSGALNAVNPHIETNKYGESVAVWSQFDGVAYSTWVSHRNLETNWSTAQAIETGNEGNVYSPEVAISDNGNAIVVWEQYDGVNYNVWANHYTLESGWDVAERIEAYVPDGGVDRRLQDLVNDQAIVNATVDFSGSNGNYFRPQVAMDELGNGIVVWQKLNGEVNSIWSNRYDVDLGWQSAQVIETNDVYDAYDPKVAIDNAGNSLVVWKQFDGTRYNILSNRYDVMTNNWATASIIDNSDLGDAFDVQIAMNSNGNAVAVWEQSEGSSNNVWFNYYDSLSGWGSADYIENSNNKEKIYFYPQVAIDSLGNAVAVWQGLDGEVTSIWATRLIDGTWEEPVVIETIDYAKSLNPHVAMDSAGNAVVVWEQSDDAKNTSVSVWSNRYSVYDSRWLDAQPIETSTSVSMQTPDVAIDDFGNAFTIWLSGGEIVSSIDSLEALLPIADAGDDQFGYARDTISLAGSASYDQSGQMLNYHWHQLSGIETIPEGITTTTPTLSVPKVKAATNLEYILTVINSDGILVIDKVVVTALP